MSAWVLVVLVVTIQWVVAAQEATGTVEGVPPTSNLAVTHRPSSFSEVAGQSAVVQVLQGAASLSAPPQQVLLAGPSGTGKTTLARLFAAALFCPQAKDGAGCGSCESCALVMGAGESHPDVLELDAASNGGVDQVRDLATLASLAPALAKYRVFIIDEAHGLTREGAQAFLRLLEEPPVHTVWVLATTDPQKLPVALRSRCLQLAVTLPDREELSRNLKRVCAAAGWECSQDVIDAVLSASDEDMGVRGTVTTLAKLAPVYAGGAVPSAQQLQALLGVADPLTVREVVNSALAGKVKEAVAATKASLAECSPSVLRTQLLATIQDRLAACSNEDEARALVVLLTKISSAPSEATPLIVAVGTAATPEAAAHSTRVSETEVGSQPEVGSEEVSTGTVKDGVLPGQRSSVRAAARPGSHESVNDDPPVPDASPAAHTVVSSDSAAPVRDVARTGAEDVLPTVRQDVDLVAEPVNVSEVSSEGPSRVTVESLSDVGEDDPFYVPMEQLRARALRMHAPATSHGQASGPVPMSELLTHVAKVSPRLAVLLRKCDMEWSGSVLSVRPYPDVPQAELGAAVAAARESLPEGYSISLTQGT